MNTRRPPYVPRSFPPACSNWKLVIYNNKKGIVMHVSSLTFEQAAQRELSTQFPSILRCYVPTIRVVNGYERCRVIK
jgi:hypothetical protein